jgi:hypothetical protein
MTLEEKILQMQNGTPASARLGIPEYDWSVVSRASRSTRSATV